MSQAEPTRERPNAQEEDGGPGRGSGAADGRAISCRFEIKGEKEVGLPPPSPQAAPRALEREGDLHPS